MITLLLPGYSPENKSWLEEAAVNVAGDGETRPIYWNHWSDVHKKFDAKDKAIDTTDVLLDDFANVVAKSIGVLVLSYMITATPEKIKKVVLCGIPLNDLNDQDKEVIKKAFSGFPKNNLMIIHNDKDPHASLEDVLKFVAEISPEISVVTKEADNHEYKYFEDINKFFEAKN